MEFFDFSGTNEEEKAQALDAITQESSEVEFFFDYNINDDVLENCQNACGTSNHTKSLYHMNGENSVLTNGAQHGDEFQDNSHDNSSDVSYSNQQVSDNSNQSLSFTSQQHHNWELANNTANSLSSNIQIQPNGATGPVVRAAPQYIYHQHATPYFAPHNSLYPISPEQMQALAAQQHSVNSISNQSHSLKEKSLRMPYSSNNSSNYKNSTKFTSANMSNCDIRNSFYMTPHHYTEMQIIDTNRLNSSAMPVSVNGGPIISESGIVASNGAPVGVPAHLGHPHHNQHPPAYGFPPAYPPALFQHGPYPHPVYFFPPEGPYMHHYGPFPPNTAPAHMMPGVPHPTLIPSVNSAIDMTSQSSQPAANILQSMSSATTTSNLSSSVSASASSTSIAAAYHSSEGSQSDTPTSFDQAEDTNANLNYSYSYSETSNDAISDKKESEKEMVNFQHNQNEQVPTELETALKDVPQSNPLCPSKPEIVSHTVYNNSFPSLARDTPSIKVEPENASIDESPNVELFSKLSSLQISMETNKTQNLQESNVKNSIIDTLFSSVTNNKPFASPFAQNAESNINDLSEFKTTLTTTQDLSNIAVENNTTEQNSFDRNNTNNSSSTWASKLFGSAPNNVDSCQTFVNSVKPVFNSDVYESNIESINDDYQESYTSKNSFVNSQNNSRNYIKNRSPNFDVDNDSLKITIISMNEDPVAFRIAKRLKESIKLKHALPTIMPRGLINRGNWCYVNATLQALLACPPFYNLMREISETQGFFRVNTSTPIIDNFVRYFSRFLPTNLKRHLKLAGSSANSYLEELLKNDPIEPLCIYDTLKHIGMIKNDAQRGHQEDAEEFLSSVLNGLNEEMISIANLLEKQPESNGKMNGLGSNNGHELPDNLFVDEDESAFDPNSDDNIWHEVGTSKHKALPTRSTTIVSTAITEIFGGSTLDVRTVNKDNNSCGNRQPFFTLQLDIKSSKITNLEDAIRWQTRPQIIQGYTCSKTKQVVEANSQMFLETLPPILILHLKLFDYDIETGVGRKLLKHINFNENLEIPRDCLSRNTDNRACKRYKLLGVVYHDGSEAAKGHYITDVYHLGLNQWVRCDDASISVTSLPKVLAGREGNLVPYLLFYRRQDTLLTRPSSSNAANNTLSFNSGAHAPNGSNKYSNSKSPNDYYVNHQQSSGHNHHSHPQQQQQQQHNEVHNINTSNKFSSISRH